MPITPNRGLILDRNGVVLANNYSAYTLEIAPGKVDHLEETIDALAEVVEIQPRDRKRFKRLLEESRSVESLPIRTRLTDEEVARFTAQRFRFAGVEIKARLFRNYPLGEVGSHLIGYIGRINPTEKKQMEDDWSDEDLANYRGTEYIGKLGVEQSYESELHGTTGFEEVEMSAGGHAVRRLKSNPPTPGNALVLSIDIRLQAMVEQLFGDRRGALVAIDPRNGEVLAFVSKPNFDPNLFVDGIDVENWRALNDSPDKPLLNRALRGTYPPGSTYKPFMALAALTLGKRTPQQTIFDPGFFNFGNHRFRDDKEGGHGTVDMYKSIVQSCDTYYYMLANDLGVDAMHDFMAPLGFGQLTGIDVQGELRGTLPSTEWKRTAYRKKEAQKWYAGETISLGIGQGYNAFTMLQLAQAEATIAAGGQRFTPHLVRAVENYDTRDVRPLTFPPLAPLEWKPEHVAFIHNALYGVTQEGTSARSFVGAPYKSGGKTGTAQVIEIKANEKYNASRTRRAAPRPRALRGVRAARGAARRACGRRRERRLRRRRGGADRAPRLRLPARRQVSERGRHRRDAARPDDRPDRRAAVDRRRAVAGRDRRRRGDGARERSAGAFGRGIGAGSRPRSAGRRATGSRSRRGRDERAPR